MMSWVAFSLGVLLEGISCEGILLEGIFHFFQRRDFARVFILRRDFCVEGFFCKAQDGSSFKCSQEKDVMINKPK